MSTSTVLQTSSQAYAQMLQASAQQAQWQAQQQAQSMRAMYGAGARVAEQQNGHGIALSGTAEVMQAWFGISSPVGTVLAGRGRQRRTISASTAFKLVKRVARTMSPEQVVTKTRTTGTLAIKARENGQQGLYEEMTRQLAQVSVETKLLEAGFPTYIAISAIDGFAQRSNGGVNLTSLENYGRTIPDDVAEKLKKAKGTGLFHKFSILHAGQAMIKTMAQRIREKDPILFGYVATHLDRAYVIADWVDEWCHLTLAELVCDPKFTGSLQAIDVDEAKLADEHAKREQLLAETNAGTWKRTLEQAKKLERPTGPTGKGIFGWFKK